LHFFRNKETTETTDYQVFIVLDILLFYNEMLNLLLQLFQQLTASSQFFQSNFLKNKNLKKLFHFRFILYFLIRWMSFWFQIEIFSRTTFLREVAIEAK
jgi:hypothetical protein